MTDKLVLTPTEYNEIKGSLIRGAIDKGLPDPSEYEVAKASVDYKLVQAKKLQLL